MTCPEFSQDECAEYKNEKVKEVVCTDKKSKCQYRYINRSQDVLSVYKVDDCLIKESEIKKCDYLLLNCTKKYAIFIELKGSDIKVAIQQIMNTMERLKINFLNTEFQFHARIVLTKVRTPDVRDTALVTFKKQLKKYNGNLIYGSIKLIEKV